MLHDTAFQENANHSIGTMACVSVRLNQSVTHLLNTPGPSNVMESGCTQVTRKMTAATWTGQSLANRAVMKAR